MSEHSNQREFTRYDISDALSKAREEIFPQIEIRHLRLNPVIRDSNKPFIYGDSEIDDLVRNAIAKAIRGSGNYWLPEIRDKKYGAGSLIFYDAEHSAGILDALTELSQSRGNLRYRSQGVTPDVIWRAEEILFNLTKAK